MGGLYNGRVFRSVSSSENGEVSAQTRFHYHQDDAVVWAEYSGGHILKGFLIATLQDDDCLEMRYQHINTGGALMTGRCRTVPERLPDGRLRLHETWEWTSGDRSTGVSTLEEVEKGA
ncbi:hypothetical protein ACRALDRAFT_1059284 [Sodiomyces alcalophilus JCM 7366]|uniref:uncharacterized protein n=1 Tax=Sodiomyces alcalophilus JCM 7366 TaxID=591952 RepID=UPI0039B443AC